MADLNYSIFVCFFPHFLLKKIGINSEKCLNMASSDSQTNKPQCGCPKRAELMDVNINTGAQSINTERASLITNFGRKAILQCMYSLLHSTYCDMYNVAQ